VFVGGVLQVVMQVPALLRLQLLQLPRWNLRHEAVRRIGRLMGPAIIGSSMGQLSVMLSTAVASLLSDGSMTWLFFADRLVEFPLGVFSIALATVILPSLSSHHAQQTPAEFAETLAWALRLVCLIVIPASVAMLALAGPLTVVIYHRGEFTGFDVDMTQRALMAFTLALLGWSLIKVLATGYYARQDTKGPVRIAMRSLGVTMALNLLVLAGLWLTGNLKSAGAHTLLALTNGVGAMMNAGLLYMGLARMGIIQPGHVMRGMLARIVIASSAMAALLAWLGGDLAFWLESGSLARVLRLSGLIAVGSVVYFGVLWLLGVRAGQFRLQPPLGPASAGQRKSGKA
jgi:putative peptidoglycan lipid II flippase